MYKIYYYIYSNIDIFNKYCYLRISAPTKLISDLLILLPFPEYCRLREPEQYGRSVLQSNGTSQRRAARNLHYSAGMKKVAITFGYGAKTSYPFATREVIFARK